jgi:hypothetical protein
LQASKKKISTRWDEKEKQFARILALTQIERFTGAWRPGRIGRPKRGRPRKGESRAQKQPTRLELQETRTLLENLADLPTACDWDSKRNGKGHVQSWRGQSVRAPDVRRVGHHREATAASAGMIEFFLGNFSFFRPSPGRQGGTHLSIEKNGVFWGKDGKIASTASKKSQDFCNYLSCPK